MKIVCLSERDSRLLYKFYGRKATHISSMALQDKLPSGLDISVDDNREKFALFVVGHFMPTALVSHGSSSMFFLIYA